MKCRFRLLAAAVCLLLLAAGCTDVPGGESESSETEPFVALPGIDLSTLLTVEQVAQGLEVSVEELDEPILFDDGTGVRYTDKTYTVNLDVTLQQLSKERLSHVRAACEGLDPAPNLGDTAFFDSSNGILYVFFDDYVMNIYVEKEDISQSTRLIVSRHFAALVLDALA